MTVWRDDAACRDAGLTHLFYPPPQEGAGRPRRDRVDPYAAARVICERCPVRADCLTDAIATSDMHGMRGGLDPDQLRTTRRTHPRPCDLCAATFTPTGMNQRYCGPVCRRAQATQNNREHMQRVRAERRLFVCDRCGLDFGYNSDAHHSHVKAAVIWGGCAA